MRANEWRLLGWAIYSASVPLQWLVNAACGGLGDPWCILVARGFFVCLPLYLALELCLSRARRADMYAALAAMWHGRQEVDG